MFLSFSVSTFNSTYASKSRLNNASGVSQVVALANQRLLGIPSVSPKTCLYNSVVSISICIFLMIS
jgi:hypothetical protein